MAFGDGFHYPSIPFVAPLQGTASLLISNPEGTGWIPASIVDEVVSASVNINYISVVSSSGNIVGNGTSGSQITLKDNISLNSVTASFLGNLIGTASYALNAASSSQAQSSSYTTFAANAEVANILTGFTASNYLTTLSFANYTGSALSQFAGTASYSTTATTASYVPSASNIANFDAEVRKQISGSQYVTYNTSSGVVSLPYTGSTIGTTPVILGQTINQLNGLSQISASVLIGNTFVTGSQALGANLQMLTGSNRPAGVVQLNNSSVTVSNSLVSPNSIIFITKQTNTKNNGVPSISTKTSGSFTIQSNVQNDNDLVGYLIFNPI